MDIPKATIDGLRKKHGRIFASTIRLPSGNELGFAWRLPEMADWTISEEANRGSGGGISGAEAANRQIMAAVIVHPARAGIMDALRPYPLAINQWFSNHAAPYYGFNATIETVAVPEDDEHTKQLQAEHGPLKQTTIKMPALAGGDEVSFYWRTPRHEDWENVGQVGTASDDLKSLVSLAVEPERKVLAKALNRYPMAVQAFVQQQVLPFFGHGAAVETIEL